MIDWWGKTEIHVQKPVEVLLCHKSDKDCKVLNPGIHGDKVKVKFTL
jgi:hypothetical protein